MSKGQNLLSLIERNLDLGSYRDELNRIETLLAAADGDGLLRLFERARAIRDGWLERQSGGEEI